MSDDDWLQSKLREEETCFYIVFGDKDKLLLSRTKLETLCEALPALPLLLFGHPGAGMKEKVTERRSDNGIVVLKLMGVDLSLEAFLPIMKIVLGMAHLPAEESAVADLFATVSLLGGCDQIENEIRIKTRSRCPPTHPKDDVNDEYDWKQHVVISSLTEKIGEQYQKWFDQGWTATQDLNVRQCEGSCGYICTNLLRRPKRRILKHTGAKWLVVSQVLDKPFVFRALMLFAMLLLTLINLPMVKDVVNRALVSTTLGQRVPSTVGLGSEDEETRRDDGEIEGYDNYYDDCEYDF